MAYLIKGIKNFKGRHGEPKAQGAIYFDSKKVADWSDDMSGGPTRWNFTSNEEESKFVDFGKTYLLRQKDYDGNVFDVSKMDEFAILENTINFMSYAAQEEKELKKLCKNKIVFHAGPSESEKKMYSVNLQYTQKNIDLVRKQHPDILDIVNETLSLPFDDEIKTATAQSIKKRKP